MPTTEQLRKRLLDKLKELFQLNQPDLDFGFYRIMHAKAEQVEHFIKEDLLQVIADTFGEADEKRRETVKLELDKAIQQALHFGAPDPEVVPAVKEAREKYNSALATDSVEGDIYDHLYRFFERYYDGGDFISRRYYARETSGKAAPFAIPYNGEEVKLHWANADQYYIKTAEHFSNYTVDLNQAKEIREARESDQGDLLGGTIPDLPTRVHFRIVQATEGEHGNIKASDDSKRFFIVYEKNPVEINESGELVLNFEYRTDPDKAKQEGPWRDKLNADAFEIILKSLKGQAKVTRDLARYIEILTYPAPTDKDKKRPLLAKYLNKYTARNTMDYFIHKDLGGFLTREMDFYIKNEFMRLDDIMDSTAPAVESYLDRIKVFRKIACQLIDFLAQLENFQKKLWLKKKFVVETSWCIRIDQVPEKFYPEIAANKAQLSEWNDLFANWWKAADKDLVDAGAAVSLTSKTRVPTTVMIDTRHFDSGFTERLLDAVEDLDEKIDGLLVHSENFQALNLIQERFREQVKCVYIDPPYNAPNSEIVYKNNYKHSSFLSLINDRLSTSKSLSTPDGSHIIAIDKNEENGVFRLITEVFPDADNVAVTVEHNRKGVQDSHFSFTNEYALFSVPSALKSLNRSERPESEWEFSNFRNWGGESLRTDAANCFYSVLVKDGKIVGFGDVWRDESLHPKGANVQSKQGIIEVYPIDNEGVERKWRYERGTVEAILWKLQVEESRSGLLQIRIAKTDDQFKTVWYSPRFNAGDNGTALVRSMGIPLGAFDYPKSVYTPQDCIFAVTDPKAIILDYFAGSGTTGHSVINLNRDLGSNRKFVLVEMGSYFFTVPFTRLKKAVFTPEWKDGIPKRLPTQEEAERSPRIFKVLRLESYEDTLNNLVLADKTLDDLPKGLQKEYTMSYMLDVETKSSPSLLNLDAFADPTAYTLTVKKPGSEEYTTRTVDLVESFNYLIGLRVDHMAAPVTLDAKFKREEDPELPASKATKLIVDGKIREVKEAPWWFRKVEGWVPADPLNPNNGQKNRVLLVWRKLTGDLERDNLMLDEWFTKIRVNPRDREFDIIYVNGSNNLQNIATETEKWKVRLIEEEFMKKMWEEAEG